MFEEPYHSMLVTVGEKCMKEARSSNLDVNRTYKTESPEYVQLSNTRDLIISLAMDSKK